MKGVDAIYGLHAVRAMLERHPERVRAVRLAERRDDPRVRAIEELAHRHGLGLLVLLDGVEDPHNLGACLRSADACGALAVVVPKDRAAQVTATVRKVAAGAAETTPVVVAAPKGATPTWSRW